MLLLWVSLIQGIRRCTFLGLRCKSKQVSHGSNGGRIATEVLSARTGCGIDNSFLTVFHAPWRDCKGLRSLGAWMRRPVIGDYSSLRLWRCRWWFFGSAAHHRMNGRNYCDGLVSNFQSWTNVNTVLQSNIDTEWVIITRWEPNNFYTKLLFG